MEKFSVGPIQIRYCKKCFNHELDYNPGLVFHAIRTEDLDRHPNFILRPENKDGCEHEAPHYHKYLPRDFIHLGNLEITGIGLNDNDVHFCFEIEKLKQRYPNMRFMDSNVWDILGFFNVEENGRKDLEERLFVPNYSIKLPTEVLLEELDLRLTKFCLVYDNTNKSLIPELKRSVNGDFPTYDATKLKDIVNKHYQLLVLECDHIIS